MMKKRMKKTRLLRLLLVRANVPRNSRPPPHPVRLDAAVAAVQVLVGGNNSSKKVDLTRNRQWNKRNKMRLHTPEDRPSRRASNMSVRHHGTLVQRLVQQLRLKGTRVGIDA
jgi:hypothetical protein